MCDECGRSICAEMCPNYGGRSAEGGRSRGRCPICDAIIREKEPTSLRGGRAVCESCGEIMGSLRDIRYKMLYNARRAISKERRVND